MNTNEEQIIRLFVNNPGGLGYIQFVELTGIHGVRRYGKYKKQAEKHKMKNFEETALKFKLRKELITEMRLKMKRKYGYANLKHTPLEN